MKNFFINLFQDMTITCTEFTKSGKLYTIEKGNSQNFIFKLFKYCMELILFISCMSIYAKLYELKNNLSSVKAFLKVSLKLTMF